MSRSINKPRDPKPRDTALPYMLADLCLRGIQDTPAVTELANKARNSRLNPQDKLRAFSTSLIVANIAVAYHVIDMFNAHELQIQVHMPTGFVYLETDTDTPDSWVHSMQELAVLCLLEPDKNTFSEAGELLLEIAAGKEITPSTAHKHGRSALRELTRLAPELLPVATLPVELSMIARHRSNYTRPYESLGVYDLSSLLQNKPNAKGE